MTTAAAASQTTVRDDSKDCANTTRHPSSSATATARDIWQRIYTHGHDTGLATRAASFDRSHPTLRIRTDGWTTDLPACAMASGLTPQGALLPAGRDVLPWEDTSTHADAWVSSGTESASEESTTTGRAVSVAARAAGSRDILAPHTGFQTGRRVLAGMALGAIGIAAGIAIAIAILILAAALMARTGAVG